MRKVSGFSIAAGVLLALMAVLAGGAALRESVTFDEMAHVGAGLSYWQKLDFRMNPEHPPLAKALAGLPLAVRGTRADYKSIQWTICEHPFPGYVGQWVFGDWVLFHWNDPVATLAWARFPMLLLTLVLGWVMFVFGRRLGGGWGGLLVLGLYASTPCFLAFGPLVHTDLAIALFSLLTIWTFADLYREPSRRRVWIFAACLAGALLSKFTAGLLLLAFPVFALIARWLPLPGQPAGKEEARLWRRPRRRAVWRGIWLAGAMVYVVYLILSWNQPTWVLDHIPGGAWLAPLRRLLMPVWEYVLGLLFVAAGASRPTFILGHAYTHGVWFYYPVLLVLKSPLGFLAMLVLGVAAWLLARKKLGKPMGVIPASEALHWRALWVALIVLTGACLASRLDFSIRHFSVPLAVLILLLAPLPATLEKLRASRPRTARTLQALAAAAVASCLVAALLAYPNYFPFMNVLSSGHPAYTLVNDSNVDWNQSLPEVRRFAERHGLHDLAVDAYGFTNLAFVVPGARLWDCQKPGDRDRGQWVVVSGNMILDGHNCQWLEGLPHEEIAGGSMYAFRLPALIQPAGSPGGPPLPAQFRPLWGAPPEFDMRVLFQELSGNPDQIPAAMKKFQERYEREQAKAKRAVAQRK
ncbi:MAG: ArnT family glycosyltransferase [Bryobacteraceae bacterium]